MNGKVVLIEPRLVLSIYHTVNVIDINFFIGGSMVSHDGVVDDCALPVLPESLGEPLWP